MKTLDDYPDVLIPDEVREILRCGVNNAYAFFNRKDFPVIKFGTKKVTPKSSFKKWLVFEAEKENECLNCPKLNVLYQANDISNITRMLSQLNKKIAELESWLNQNDPPHSVRAAIVKDLEINKRALEVLNGRFSSKKAVV